MQVHFGVFVCVEKKKNECFERDTVIHAILDYIYKIFSKHLSRIAADLLWSPIRQITFPSQLIMPSIKGSLTLGWQRRESNLYKYSYESGYFADMPPSPSCSLLYTDIIRWPKNVNFCNLLTNLNYCLNSYLFLYRFSYSCSSSSYSKSGIRVWPCDWFTLYR